MIPNDKEASVGSQCIWFAASLSVSDLMPKRCGVTREESQS